MTAQGALATDRAQAKQRKRGEALEQEIFEAALALFETEGALAVTFSAVAKAAHTSRSVLYRRWPTTHDLLVDALNNRLARGGRLIERDFNKGSLCDDLKALLNFLVSTIAVTDVEFMLMLLARSNTAPKPTDVEQSIARADVAAMDNIIRRALARGEIAREPSQLVKLLPFELIRSRIIMGSRHIDSKYIASVVDEIMLPLLASPVKNRGKSINTSSR